MVVTELGGVHKNPYMNKDMRHIVLKLLLLKRIKGGRTYSYALIKEFSNDRISGLLQKEQGSVKNDIYNTINALEKSGYIKVVAEAGKIRPKKYYTITKSGNSALLQTKRLFMGSMKSLMKILG
jgi:DNA-binding PadR family transcriptional regulator